MTGNSMPGSKVITKVEEQAIVVREETYVQDRPQNYQSLPKEMINVTAQVQEIMGKLDNARIVGLTGMGGLGKTTTAKATFNDLVSRFEYCCFVHDVRLIRGGEDDLKDAIWDQLYCRGKKVEGRTNWFSVKGKRLLLVLDAIDSYCDERVLLDLANDGAVESRFIVTSRNQALLKSLGEVYVLPYLNADSATLLFKNHAFPNREIPPKELEGVMESIIRTCDGLPLTLEVAGKFLQGNENFEVWEQTFHALEKAEEMGTVNERLWANLRVSYDCLEPEEKEVFLDASTFFCTGPWTLREAKAAWSAAYKTHESLLWQRVVDMSLVHSVGEDELIQVQQQLKTLGQMIARESSNNDKLRIWEGELGLRILQTANDVWEGKRIHALRLDEHGDDEKGSHTIKKCIHIPRAALLKLKKVQFLEIKAPVIIDGAETEGASVPTEVILLKCIGQDLFDPCLQTRLAVLKLSYLNYLPGSTGQLSALKYMEIHQCDVQSLPESFGLLSALMSLSFSSCSELQTLPESFGDLSALESLNFSSCDRLDRLPRSFGKLSALETLEISHCHNLRSLPESFGKLSALKTLIFSHCILLDSLPGSSGKLSALETLKISHCYILFSLPESFGELSALETLEISHCYNLLSLPESFGELSTLKTLKFSSCIRLDSLPGSFGLLSALETLDISECHDLRSLPESFGKLSALKSLKFSYCNRLDSLPGSFGLLSALETLDISECYNLRSLPAFFRRLSALKTPDVSVFDNFLPESLSDSFLPASLDELPSFDDKLLAESFRVGTPELVPEFSYCDSLESLPGSWELAVEDLSFGHCDKTIPESFGQLSASNISEYYFNDVRSLPTSLERLSARGASKSVRANQELLNDFRKNVEEGGEDGYFVSNIWLHSLEEYERNSLTSTLWGGGYSEIHQTATATLFARLENDVQFQVTGKGASSTFTDNIESPGYIDDELGIAWEGLTAREEKVDIAGVFSPVETGKTKEPPAKKMKSVEFPLDTVLRKIIRDLLKKRSGSDFRKVTFQDIASQLEAKFKVDISAKMDHVKSLILQEASRSTEGALMAQTPIFKEAVEAMEVGAAEKYNDSGIVIDHGRKIPEEQVSVAVPRVEVAFDEVLLKSMELEQRSKSSSTLESMEQIFHPLVCKTPNTDGSTYPCTSSSPYPAERQATTWRSFRAAIKSNRHHSFCVSTQWISKLEHNEKETLALICLEAGYDMRCQTKTTTWYERIHGNMGNKRTSGGGNDNDPSTSYENIEVSGSDINNPRTPQSGSSLGKRKNVDQADEIGGSGRPAIKKATREVQNEKVCTCHPQLLTVACSSGELTPVNIEPPPGRRIKKQKFGDDLVFTTANKVRSEKISATVDRRFSMTTVDFPSGQEISINLTARAIISLSCCLKAHNDHHKVRVKLSEIYGEVKNESSSDQPCNGTVLSTVCTNLFVTRIDDENDVDAWEEITLKPQDEEYQDRQYRRVLERGDPTTTSGDHLVWLSISNVHPDGCDSPSITLELRGDVKKRRKIDFETEIPRAHVLRFQDIQSDGVIFEGDVRVNSASKLELKIRQRLEISYYKPDTPIVRERTVWSAICTPKIIDFDCCLDIRVEKFNFGKETSVRDF